MSADAILDSLRRIVTAFVGTRLDHLALYPAVVRQQRTDGTLDLHPEDARVPSCQGVPIRLGLPGVTVTVAVGARVLLGYENGNPARPVATLWESGTVTLLEIDATMVRVNGGSLKVARATDAVTAHANMTTWMGGVNTSLTSVGAASVPLPVLFANVATAAGATGLEA